MMTSQWSPATFTHMSSTRRPLHHHIVAPDPVRRLHRRIGHAVWLGAGVLVLVAGAALLAVAISGHGVLDSYLNAPVCPDPRPCRQQLTANVVRTTYLRQHTNSAAYATATVQVGTQDTTLQLLQPTRRSLAQGLPPDGQVTVVDWEGKVTEIDAPDGQSFPTLDYPGTQQGVYVFALPLLGIGGWWVLGALHMRRHPLPHSSV